MKTVATINGNKAHYANPRTDTTLCGREISNATTTTDMCKRCETAAQKLNAWNARIAYNADVAETQDDVMNEATPAERTGVDLTAEQEADKTIRQYKLSDTMVETLTYRYSPLPQAVNAQMWCDARTEKALVKRGLMHPTDSHRTVLGHEVTRILLAPYDKPSQEIPGQLNILEVDPQDTPAPKIPAQRPKPTVPADNDLSFWGKLGKRGLSYRMLDALTFLVTGQSDGTQTTGTWQSLVDLGYVVMHTNGVDVHCQITDAGTEAYRFVFDSGTTAVKSEIQTATCYDCHEPAGTEHAWDCRYSRNVVPAPRPAGPERPGFVSVPLGIVAAQVERDMERDAYAKTVAKQYDRSRQLSILADDGSIPQPDRLIREIRSMMADIVTTTSRDVMDVMKDVGRLAELGWLLAYVMESGTVDSDGWQDRRRPAVPGWEDQETYDLDTDSSDALPAWADWQRNDEGCRGVIDPGSREQPAEHCGTPVTREEYYAAGDEGVRCEVHRTSFERAGEQPW